MRSGTIGTVSDEEDRARRARAEARRTGIVVARGRLGDEVDLVPVRGAEAVALAVRLSEAAWLMSGRPLPAPRQKPVAIELRRRKS